MYGICFGFVLHILHKIAFAMIVRATNCRTLCRNLRNFLKFQTKAYASQSNASATTTNQSLNIPLTSDGNIHFQQEWPTVDRQNFLRDMLIIEDFLTVSEEESLFAEVEPYMKRLRYEFDHWDDAIHGFRETERQKWYPDNKKVIDRVNATAFVGSILPHIHVLDLADKGVIKPHVDSSRYCGSTIAGLSILSDSVMRLVRTDETKYVQSKEGSTDDYRNVNPETEQNSTPTAGNYFADLLLKRRSLYIMKDTARYHFTHEIRAGEKSVFRGEPIIKGRRISVICRNKP